MAMSLRGLVAVDPILLFAILLVVALVVFWDGKVWAFQTARRRRVTVAASIVAAFAWFWVPRGDFWWIW